MVAGLQRGLADGLAVEERAVGTPHVDEAVASFDLAKLRVAPRHLGIMEPDRVAGVPTQTEHRTAELELFALVGASDYDHTRHGTPSVKSLSPVSRFEGGITGRES